MKGSFWPSKTDFFLLTFTFLTFCTLKVIHLSSDGGICLDLVTKDEHNSKSELSCFKKD